MRPQAASRQEELERSEARRAAEDGILKLTAEWQERMARARQAQDAATAAHGAEPAVEEEEPPAGKQADADPAAIESLTAERDRLQAELETLREENGRLRSSNEELRAESGRRDDETRKLNDLIVRSRRTEEQWRQAYVESRKGRRPDDTPVRIDSVGEAVALARAAFGDRLLIKLNSRSNENTPSTNPAEVYDALAWLATAHCDGNDNRIGEACSGWTYKTSQREESIAKYREWYETLADGKTWFLGAHIGKGTRRDPRHTIRIGFVRDQEDHRVIVGFHRPAPAKPAVMKKRKAVCGSEWTAGVSPDGWTARVGRDLSPPWWSAVWWRGSRWLLGRGPRPSGRPCRGVAGHARRVLARLDRGRCPRIASGSGYDGVAQRTFADTLDAAAAGCGDWRGVACRRSSRMAGCTTGMGREPGGSGLDARRLRVVRLRLEAARRAAQPADPGRGRPGRGFAA